MKKSHRYDAASCVKPERAERAGAVACTPVVREQRAQALACAALTCPLYNEPEIHVGAGSRCGGTDDREEIELIYDDLWPGRDLSKFYWPTWIEFQMRGNITAAGFNQYQGQDPLDLFAFHPTLEGECQRVDARGATGFTGGHGFDNYAVTKRLQRTSYVTVNRNDSWQGGDGEVLTDSTLSVIDCIDIHENSGLMPRTIGRNCYVPRWGCDAIAAMLTNPAYGAEPGRYAAVWPIYRGKLKSITVSISGAGVGLLWITHQGLPSGWDDTPHRSIFSRSATDCRDMPAVSGSFTLNIPTEYQSQDRLTCLNWWSRNNEELRYHGLDIVIEDVTTE